MMIDLTKDEKKAYIISPDGTTTEVAPKNEIFDGNELHSIIEGYFEAVWLPNKYVMFVDEDGKRKGLQVNTEASNLAKDVIHPSDYIVGKVVVCPLSMVD
jgi:hypothetical protein